ncbi:MAG: right-handed parallel beta-helix repeat-containing protein, partial [Flavobacteriales bacterium]|nr:right-handed parallel beta-helix repeat-containing protein [Flavobacteriales bacterium]
MKKKRPEILTLLLLVVSGLLITGKGFGAMNGAYTINQGAPASATNYMSVNSAMSDLQFGWRSDGGPVNGPGVTGPVTLRIVPGSGPYYEQVSVSFIPGTYPNVPVRLTGGATYETIEFTPDSVPDKHVIKLSGVMNLILDSLTIRNGARTSGYGVWITDNSDNNTIQNCRIELDSISTSAGLMGIAMISAKGTPGSNGSGNVISGNEIVGGYKGIVCNGKGTTEHAQKNQILGNRIYQSTNSGISLSYQDATLVSSNVVHSERDPYGGLRGIEINSGDSVVVEKNEVVISGFMGIIIANVNIGLPKKTMGAIARNNMVVLNRKKGYQHYNAPNGYGFYLYNSNIVGVAHNSVSFSLSDAGRGICVEKGSDYDIRNNSVYMPEAYNGYVIYTDSMSRIKVLDYNNYYVAGRARHFMYLGNEYLDTNYVGVGGFNLHSKVGNPYYLDPTRDLHTYSLDLDGAGDPTVGVGEDFDGEVRPNSPSGFPDIGADEYMPLAIDARVIKHLTPLDAICPDDNVVAVVIENMGTNPLNNINITSNITGASNDVISANYFGPLPSHKKDTLYVGAFNPGSGGKVQIETYCSVSGDQYLRNDTIRDSVLINPIPPQPVILKADTTCEGGQVELVVSASADSYWYDA